MYRISFRMFYTVLNVLHCCICFCGELLPLYACTYRIPYTIFTSVKGLLGCIHLHAELFTMPSLLYRTPYRYSHIWMLINQMLLATPNRVACAKNSILLPTLVVQAKDTTYDMQVGNTVQATQQPVPRI